ncbi:hypothetical protein VOI54_03695 [Tamlana sp. 2201CG12-4]|uniref:hypothetical protein n=1 Tax=Tamlana sp. 2201CG12-4 TaxID=3112582 RepID=UPI002DBC26A6|nr:hypothetical protein [Tamlana sp. 2201CG12-4]MEC3906106.1 hypothetical protein [Tamlana sp. 2201CG12-4]
MIKRTIILTLALLCALTTNAQFVIKKKAPKVSKKEQRKIDEKKQEINNLAWDNSSIHATTLEIPEKWQNESAVFLLKSIRYIYNRPNNSIEYTKIERNRIKLFDQAAVKEFSELSYEKDNSYRSYGLSRVTNTFFLGIKIIKPDGEELIVDIDEAIDVESEKKLAIPNLEKGDIIDYYFYTNSILGENDLYKYKPVEHIIGSRYPILHYYFGLDTEKDFFMSFNTYNGAPDLIKAPASLNRKESKKRHYSFEQKDVQKNDFPIWFYPMVELPSYKFQVNFARTGKYEKRAYAFIPNESDIVKKEVSPKDIFEFYEDKFSPSGSLGDLKRFLKDNAFSSDEEKVKAAYYYIRHAYFTNYIEASVVSDAKILTYPFQYYDSKSIFFDTERKFIKYFAAFLKDIKIDYEILVGTKRYNGSIKNFLLESNASFLIKVNTPQPIYIENFNHFSNVNQVNSLLENTEAYALEVVNRKHIEDIQTVKIPESTHNDNTTTEKLSLFISPDFSNINVKRYSSYTGHNKINEQKDRLKFYDYVFEDYKKYGTLSLVDRIRKKKTKEKFNKTYKGFIEKEKEEQKENFKKQSSSEYELELDDYSFSIKNTGRYGKLDSFEFEEEFTINKDLIKRAGGNYIIQIGKLIGNQVDLDAKQKQRKDNIYMNYPRSFSNEITLNIPEGYTVSGLEAFNTSVENKTGGFVSSANIEGSELKIKTHKYYMNYYEPNTNWNQMILYLEAAFQFTQTKILLKKSN